MKQYAKIYVPDKLGTLEVKDVDLEFPEEYVQALSNKIVLSLEELKDMWRAAEYSAGQSFQGSGNYGLYGYLKEKGIKI